MLSAHSSLFARGYCNLTSICASAQPLGYGFGVSHLTCDVKCMSERCLLDSTVIEHLESVRFALRLKLNNRIMQVLSSFPLSQGSPNYGPRAKSGPRSHFIRPA